ncbi:MAG: hypothetical protein JO362_15865 [Streptomycetaceae bacterium]|nr:hypothetical protein [Streptomycetaceae bacterium]
MNNSPGWASPGSAPSDPDEPVAPEQPEELGQPGDYHCDGTADTAPPNWSKKQPPPSPGWGTPPPHSPQKLQGPWVGSSSTAGGPGWYGIPLPPATKPGVIPLRPLTVGEILEGTFSTIRLHWRTILNISFIVALLSQAVSTLTTGLFLKDTSSLTSNTVGAGISAIGQLFATAMLTIIVSRSVLGRPVSAGDAWRDSRPRLLQLVGMTLAVCLIAMIVIVIGAGPGILLAVSGSTAGGVTLTVLGGFTGMIVAVWLGICLSLATPVLMLEKQGVFASLARSVKLVRGAWWRIFGIQLLGTLITFIITSLITAPFAALGMVIGSGGTQMLPTNGSMPTSWPFLIIIGIGTVVGTALTSPISAGVTALLYMDQRIRREGLDIELARAASEQIKGSGVSSRNS